MNTQTRNFDTESKTWDENPARLKLAKAISRLILKNIHINSSMNAMDFGCGTGLVTLEIQPYVKSILAIDTSSGMLSVLDEKLASAGITNVKTKLIDTNNKEISGLRFDLIFSSMVMHHIVDAGEQIKQFSKMLNPGGFLCVADLDTENGDFHGGGMSVQHNGFNRDWIRDIYTQSGLSSIKILTAYKMNKPVEGKDPKDFTIFLATGRKL